MWMRLGEGKCLHWQALRGEAGVVRAFTPGFPYVFLPSLSYTTHNLSHINEVPTTHPHLVETPGTLLVGSYFALSTIIKGLVSLPASLYPA